MTDGNPTSPDTDPSSGFTLVELMVGIAVSSILLVGLFQLLTDLANFQNSYRTSSIRNHRRAALVRILDQDLTSLPKAKPDFVGHPDEFYRTTVSYDPEEGHRLETRVHYYLRATDEGQQLRRETRWTDLQDGYDDPRTIRTADRIDFRYLTASGATLRSTRGKDRTVTAVVIRLPEANLTVPVESKSSDEESDGSGTVTPPGQ
jgi:prepilin-type N-terminal cleavage/methylation domain-containing protein